MTAASGAQAYPFWADKMIAHHEGMIEMARVRLSGNPETRVWTMAQKTINMLGADIRAMQAGLPAHPMSPAQ